MSNVVNFPTFDAPMASKDDLERIRLQVAERVKSERGDQDGDDKPGGGKDGGGIDSRFVRDCLSMNEVGDGMLYRELHRKRFVFNKAANTWMYWAGHHWEYDQMGMARAAVEQVVEAYADEAAKIAAEMKEMDNGNKAYSRLKNMRDDILKRIKIMQSKGKPDPNEIENYSREADRLAEEMSNLESDSNAYHRLKDLREEILKRIWALRSTRRRENCLTMAHTIEDPLAIRGDEIDQNTWIFACANCVIDLRTGKPRPGRQEEYLLKASEIEWRGIDADCHQWVQFLRLIFEEDQIDDDDEHPVTDFMQRLLGYAIIGSDQLHIFPVLTGQGRNGKGTIVKVLLHILGKMADTLRPEMLLDNGGNSNAGGPTPHIVGLRGLRMGFASETNDGCRISAAEVKRLTGGDRLTGRAPHDKYEVSFDPTHTIFLLTNVLPHAPADDFAFWERMLVIDFPLSFVNREPAKKNERRADIALYEKLVEEAPGILAWLVRGCLMFQQVGLNPPPKVLVNVQEYQRDEDNIGAFIDTCCYLHEDIWIGASELYDAFVIWWKKYVSKNELKQKKFGMLMRKRFKAEKVGGLYRYHGLGLLASDPIG